MQKKEPEKLHKVEEVGPLCWVETSETISRQFHFDPDGRFSVSIFLFLEFCVFFSSFVIAIAKF